MSFQVDLFRSYGHFQDYSGKSAGGSSTCGSWDCKTIQGEIPRWELYGATKRWQGQQIEWLLSVLGAMLRVEVWDGTGFGLCDFIG